MLFAKRTARFAFCAAFLVLGTANAQPAPNNVERLVIIKVDGLPQGVLDRYAQPDAGGRVRLGWINEIFARNGVWMENFYTRGISLSAPSWSLMETGQHLVIHGNVEYDRYTLRSWDYLNFFPFYLTYPASKHADMPGVELLDQVGVPLLLDRFPFDQRYQSFQLLQRGIWWGTLQRSLRQRFTAQPLKELFDEWQIGFSFSKSVYQSTERDVLRNLKNPNIKYIDYFTGEYDHTAHLTNDRVAQLHVVEELDTLVGRIWQGIQESPLADRTALILVSDHGMNTSESVYSQGYSLVDWLNSGAGGGHHVITNRHPLTEFKLKGLDPLVSEVVTASKESSYLPGRSAEYPTVVLDLDGNERANIGLRDNALNQLQILVQELTQKKITGPMRVAVLQAFLQILERERPRFAAQLAELREQLTDLRRAIQDHANEAPPVAKRAKKIKAEKGRDSGESVRWNARLDRWKAEERADMEYVAVMERLLALAETDFDPGKFKIEEVIPRKSLGGLNSIYDLQHYVVGTSAECMQLAPDGSLDFAHSFRTVDYLQALSDISVRNNVQKNVSNKPVDFIALRVDRAALARALREESDMEDGIWLRGGNGKEALLLTRHSSSGTLSIRYLPIEGFKETASGELRIQKCDFSAGAPLQLFEDDAIQAPHEWLLEWHDEREWLNAVHRSKYSNGIIGLAEQLLDQPGQPEPRRLARLRTDMLVFANDHWNFNVRGFNPGGNHASLFRASTHSVLLFAGGKETGIPKGLKVAAPYDGLSFLPTVLQMMGRPEAELRGPVIEEMFPKQFATAPQQ
ncbi:MAG: alkaline phosphatase family protein [Bryobacteraceae bacterium]